MLNRSRPSPTPSAISLSACMSGNELRHSSFELLSSFVLRHSSFARRSRHHVRLCLELDVAAVLEVGLHADRALELAHGAGTKRHSQDVDVFALGLALAHLQDVVSAADAGDAERIGAAENDFAIGL